MPTPRPARTVLEQQIRDRRMTFEEFAEYAERFARDHGEVGTLSVRHLERLTAGRRGDGRPLGPVRPATARLLERIFGLSVAELLAPPVVAEMEPTSFVLRQRIHASSRVDTATLDLLADQLDAIRRLDRQFGAIVTYREMTAKVAQIGTLLTHSLTPATRARLAELLAQAAALAGWAALDLGKVDSSWRHHEQSKSAAREAGSAALLAHATAQQAVVLLDLSEHAAAVEQLAMARALAPAVAPPALRAWLAAAHGEGLAHAKHEVESLRAFDVAQVLWPFESRDPELPYIFLGDAHLKRWRGNALAVLGHGEAVTVLSDALTHLDGTFARAAVSIRLDLATALLRRRLPGDAESHLQTVRTGAYEIGSVRQQRRLEALSGQGATR